MTLDDFLASIKSKLPPAQPEAIAAFESKIGAPLPASYREFVIRCNGGSCSGNVQQDMVSIHHIGGFREEDYFSLQSSWDIFQRGDRPRIPHALLWIMDTPTGDGICIGIAGAHVGRIYLWVHDDPPDSDTWDFTVENADNIELLAESFEEFVAGLRLTNWD